MRLTSSCTLTLALLLFACGGGGNTTDDTGTTPATPGTTEPATTGTGSASTSTDPTTSGPGTASEPATSTTTGDPTTGSTGVTSEPNTSIGPVTATTGDTTTTGEPETTGSTTDASSSTGDTGMSGGDCTVDAECALHSDCCNCYAIPVGQEDGICKKECKQSTCSVLGIDQAVCRFGVCTTEKTNCDGSKVACDALPPDCPPGQVAQVEGVCWSGACVDALSCNVVPECSYCPAGTMCVHKQAQVPTFPTCEPIPAECDGKIDCECAGSFVCTNPFDACSAPGGNEIDCACPAC